VGKKDNIATHGVFEGIMCSVSIWVGVMGNWCLERWACAETGVKSWHRNHQVSGHPVYELSETNALSFLFN